MTHETFRFAQPLFLWLLTVPGALALLWILRLVQRRRDVGRLRQSRIIPLSERFRFAGPLAFRGFLILAVVSAVLALAGPQTQTLSDTDPVDLIVLQDGSASMRVADAHPDRWQRSMRFFRTLVETLPWKEDRMGLAVFANHALPQVRLVRDPNTVIFFIEHLKGGSPFALEENTSWDTNAYEGIRWGLKLIVKDEEYHGKNPNPKGIILFSDGDQYSGETLPAINDARQHGITIHVIGVGTSSGGLIPLPKPPEAPSKVIRRYYAEWERKHAGVPTERIHSSIDRDSLRRIAALGGGRYFELDTEPDAVIASKIIHDVRKLGRSPGGQKVFNDIYWRFLLAAALFFGLGVILRR
ncbi:MAG: VWA domain-containing protein [Deltaproteobacteria bacterium]|nr:VWA domain-containing protein [Deltaproteobacteria bacterium]